MTELRGGLSGVHVWRWKGIRCSVPSRVAVAGRLAGAACLALRRARARAIKKEVAKRKHKSHTRGRSWLVWRQQRAPPGTFSRCCLRPQRQLWGGFILYTHAHTGKQCSRHAKWMPHGRLFVVRNLLPEFKCFRSIIISPMVPSAPAQAPFAGRNIAPILGRSLSGSFETVAELLVPQRDNRRHSRVRALQGGAKSSGGARGARIMAAG
jgi:hypothetical protein